MENWNRGRSDFGTRRNRSSCQTSSGERNTWTGGTTPLPTGAVLRSGECTGSSTAQPLSPDIQAQEGCSGSRSLSHSRREHWCWLEIFRNTELIYWTNFPFRSLNFKFYRVCHSSAFSPLEKQQESVWEIIQRLLISGWFFAISDRWLNNRIILYI